MVREEDNGFGEWGGYMNAKVSKLEEQFAQSSSFMRKTNLFAGISIYVNGLTDPSADELKRIMMVHGGTFHHYERSHTTYIIASNLPDVKIRNMNTSNIIKSNWVVDCLKENRILDYKKYLLHTNHKPSQPKLGFSKKDDVSMKEESIDAECLKIMKDLESLNQEIGKDLLDRGNAQSPEILEEEEPKFELLGQSDKLATKPVTRCAKSAVDPNFLSEFYNNSRLHHIATLGTGFKQYVSELRENHSGEFPYREDIRSNLPRIETPKLYPQTIMHIDMDCFFVSVGLRSRAHLRGQPVAVTHSKGFEPTSRPGADRQKERELYLKKLEHKSNYMKTEKVRSGFDGNESLSEIASCSYEARKMGVRNGMFVGQALKLCPQLKTIPYDFEEYKDVAFTLYNTVAQYTLQIEAVSCDEMFVDLSEVLNDLQVETMNFVEYVRNEVKEKTGCPCSAGVGGNRLQARMATKKAKPDGQYFLSPERVEEYMQSIPIEDLPGVGHSTSYTLEQLKIKTCGELQLVSLAKLQQELGKKTGETLHQFCRGIDNRPLVYGQIRKSISAEVNYGIRFSEFDELEKFLNQLCTEVHSRLMGIKRRGKCITLKLMVRAKEAPVETSKYMGHGYCDTLSKSTTLPDYTCDLDVIKRTILGTMKTLNIPPSELRGIGIHIAKLDNPEDSKMKKENVLKSMFSKVTEKQKATSVIESIAKHPTINEPAKNEPKTPTKNLPAKRKTSPSTPDKKPAKVEKKGRGKSKTLKTVDVSNMLQNAAKRKPNDSPLPDIDYDVLAELPADIREEVLREHKRYVKIQATKCSTGGETSSISKVQAEFLEALPPDLRSEIEKDLALYQKVGGMETKFSGSESKVAGTESKVSVKEKDTTQIATINIFDQGNCRELIESWIESSDSPEECDVNIFAQNAQELVQKRQISNLYTPLRLLHRLIESKKICAWHMAYKSIITSVQQEMIATYGSKMMLEDEIECNYC